MTLIPFPFRIMVPLPWGYSTSADVPNGVAVSSCDPKLGSRGGLGMIRGSHTRMKQGRVGPEAVAFRSGPAKGQRLGSKGRSRNHGR